MTKINVTEQTLARVAVMREQAHAATLRLRVTVEGGGCAGFQYLFTWDEQMTPDDQVFADAVVSDAVSLPFLADATVDYVVTMMGEDFKIINPNATSGCGCGTSFAV